MASPARLVALALALGVAAHVTLRAQTRLATGAGPDPVVTGVLEDEAGGALAHTDVQACSEKVCLYSETDAGGRFRFELPRRAAPFVLKTLEDPSARPPRAAALAPILVAGSPSLEMGSVLVAHLPVGRPVRPGSGARLDVEAGDGLRLTLVPRDLAPPPGRTLTTIAARRIPLDRGPRYELPHGETVMAVYALHPFGTISRSPIAVQAPAGLPAGTRVVFRTMREIDGTFSPPVPGAVAGAHVATHASRGITELTHLVITTLAP